MKYLNLFPLTIACSIKVKNQEGSFKPEYIISQLLLQYISSRSSQIDGIKYLSTKVDYKKLHNVDAYNYVFPVKTISKKGFCHALRNMFQLTEPTNLNLEEILFNTEGAFVSAGEYCEGARIQLIKGLNSSYGYSSFGKIELSLMSKLRKLGRV